MIIGVSYSYYKKRQVALCEQFEKKYIVVKTGDSKQLVEKILGPPSEIEITSIMAPCLYKNVDCVSGASLGNMDIEIWCYDILNKIYRIYFRVESYSPSRWEVYVKKYPDML